MSTNSEKNSAHDLQIERTKKKAQRILEICNAIDSTRRQLEMLRRPNGGLRAEIFVRPSQGLAAETPMYADLGPEHKKWVIAGLEERMQRFQAELRVHGTLLEG